MFTTVGSRSGPGINSLKFQYPGPCTIIQRTTSISVPNNVFWTTVTWDSVAVRDDVGAYRPSISQQNIYVPTGFRWVKLLFYAPWNNTTGGVRDCIINTSGPSQGTYNAAPWYISAEQDTVGTNEAVSLMTTGWVPLPEGTACFAQVYQNTGSNLNFSPPGGFGFPAWFMAEWGN